MTPVASHMRQRNGVVASVRRYELQDGAERGRASRCVATNGYASCSNAPIADTGSQSDSPRHMQVGYGSMNRWNNERL